MVQSGSKAKHLQSHTVNNGLERMSSSQTGVSLEHIQERTFSVILDLADRKMIA